MPIAPQQTIGLNQILVVEIATRRASDAAVDDAIQFTASSLTPSIATAAVDQTANTVTVTPLAAGFVTITVDEVPPSPKPLQIPVTITAPVNLSQVDFVSAVVQPKP